MSSLRQCSQAGALILAFALSGFGASVTSTQYYSQTWLQDSSTSGFTRFNKQNNATYATDTNSTSTGTPPYRTENEYAEANLHAGTLKAEASGSVDPTAPNGTSFLTLAQTSMGDTFTAHGSLGGGHLYPTLNISGDISQLALSGSPSLTNDSYIQVAFFTPGEFDDLNPSNHLIVDYFWGIGPNADPNNKGPAYATYEGTLPGASSVGLDIPFAQLGSTFEMVVYLGADVSGNGDGGIVWDADYSHTLVTTLATSPGITLTSAGGFAGTPMTLAAAPEPGTFMLLGMAGLALIGAGRLGRRRTL